MIIEASQIIGLPVLTGEQELGKVDLCIFHGRHANIAGFQVVRSRVLKKFYSLNYEDIIEFDRQHLKVKDAHHLKSNLKELDEIYKAFGRVLGVTAKTESGKKIGKVGDVLIEAETGLIVRFSLQALFRERLIPRQFLVSISPREVIFQDVVDQPIFDKVATSLPIGEPTLSV
jgi:uncharacterized protein YrrD